MIHLPSFARSLLLLLTLTPGVNGFSQKTLPPVLLEEVGAGEVSMDGLAKEDKPILAVFWATWCNPCIEELDNISDELTLWREKVDFELIAVCIDDSRSSASVASFAAGRQWDFRILLDPNQEAMRAMNVTVIPHYFIYDRSGRLHKKHTGYLPGDEEIILEELILCGDEK